MPVIPVYDLIVVPGSNMFYRTDLYKTMAGDVPRVGDKLIIVMAKKETTLAQLVQDDVYPVGAEGYINEVNAQGYLMARITGRVNITELHVTPERKIEVETTPRPEIEDMDPQEAYQRTEKIKDQLREMAKDYEWGGMMNTFIASWRTLGDMGSAMSPWMTYPNEKFYELLAVDSDRERFEKLEKIIYEYMELTRVRVEANDDREKNNQKLYREQAIRDQMEYLQKELDELHPEELSDIKKLEKAIEECGMNETARKEADKLLNRLKAEGPHGHEYGMLTDYLEFLTSLPWKKEEFKQIPLEDAEAALNADHFGLEKVKKRILEQIAVMQLKKEQSGSIILFVGAPGTGKTSIGQSIAKALQREYIRVSLGGVRDEADIRGHRRTYVGAMPGRIIDGIQKAGVSNPVMVLDEVDKLSMSYNGDPASALLEVLDPEQNFSFTDHYLNVPFDLSDVLFICTANSMDTIPEPLLNRMEVIQFQSYTPIEKLQIAKRHLLPRAEEAAGLTDDQLAMDESVIEEVISEFTRESGVRGLKKRMDTLCRSAAVKLVRGEEAPIQVTSDKLREFLDMKPVRQKHVKDSTIPGVVTGLAWTPVGGDILYIESRRMKGTGKLTITGQLGDVMKESAQIALSLVRSLYPDKAEALESEDVHIHVPDGATPKDGPSAGITLTTALASALTGIPVPPTVAMTGEVSLQGTVNPIGGLPEKLTAALRSGVQKAFIPKENVDDLEDVPEEVRDQLEIIPVETVGDVLSALGLLEA